MDRCRRIGIHGIHNSFTANGFSRRSGGSMRARGKQAIFVLMLALSTALPGQAKAESDYSPQYLFSAASKKIKNALGVTRRKETPRPGAARTTAKQPARPATRPAAARQEE